MIPSWMKALRVGRWALLLPWVCAMDDGCAAIEALHEGRTAAARPQLGRSPAPVGAREVGRPS